MKTRLKFNKRLALSVAAAAIAAISLATASTALASNPTPHPGGDPAGVLNPDSMRPTETRVIVHPDYVINPDSMKPTDSHTRRARR